MTVEVSRSVGAPHCGGTWELGKRLRAVMDASSNWREIIGRMWGLQF